MSTATHIHNPVTVKAFTAAAEGASWLRLVDKHGNYVAVFMPPAQAEAMAIAFNAYVDAPEPEVEPEPDDEPREYDDSSYRRDMIDAGRGHLLP
jgi:hypothetical protein